MSRQRVLGVVELAGFPRVSGDEPEDGETGGWPQRFSPRERG